MTFRVIVTGSRAWTDRPVLRTALDMLGWQHHWDLTIVHGGCPTGADAIAAEWVRHTLDLGVTEEPHPADWDLCTTACKPLPGGLSHRRRQPPGDTAHPGQLWDYCPAAGPRRNARMVSLGADLLLAAPLGPSPGTRGCMRLAAEAGMPIKEVTAC